MRLSILTTTIVVEIGIDTARFDKLQSRTKAGKVEQLNSFIRLFKTLYIYIKKTITCSFPEYPQSPLFHVRTNKNNYAQKQIYFCPTLIQGARGTRRREVKSDNFPNIIDDDCSCYSERAMWIQ